MFLWLKTLYRKRAVTWPFIFYTIIWTLSKPVGTFVGKLDSLKSLLYLKAFKVNDKDNLKPRDILVILD